MRRMMMTTCTKTLSLLRHYLKKKTTMADLPPDVVMVILSKLPVKSISRFRCVCKLWNEWFKNPKFIKMHFQHATQNYRFSVLLASYNAHGFYYYSIDFDETNHSIDTFRFTSKSELHMVSCDGLIGLHDYGIMMCLSNPSTLEYKHILTVNHNESLYKNSFSRYGVWYDWKIDDYKLFKLVAETQFSVTSEVWVCRLGSDSWDSVGNIPYNVRHINISEKPLNGIIHWIGNTKVIVSFDIAEERFEERIKEIQIPCCYLDDGLYSYKDMRVGILGEDLYLSVNARHERNIDLWVMTDYGVIDSWTKTFSLSKDDVNFDRLLPLHYLYKNRKILLQGLCPKVSSRKPYSHMTQLAEDL